MNARSESWLLGCVVSGVVVLAGCVDDQVVEPVGGASYSQLQSNGPSLVDGNLEVRAVVEGFVTPVSLAFIGAGDVLVLEKNTGKVQQGRRRRGPVDGARSGGELRIRAGAAWNHAASGLPRRPGRVPLLDREPGGCRHGRAVETPLLGNRVDRFVWDGSSLTLEENLIQLRAIQQDADQPERGNHNGGVIRFGPDGKLYIFIGDVGRRGQLQNLRCGPVDVYDCPPGAPVPDDQFGGPEPDDAHLTGVILRLNPDGSTPDDNPFFAAGAAIGGEVGQNIQKIFSYGHRNSFGMAFDPKSGDLWLQENGDDAFSEINRVAAGDEWRLGADHGPGRATGRVQGHRDERDVLRTAAGALAAHQHRRMRRPKRWTGCSCCPGAHYSDPEFSWRFEVAPGGIGFVGGRAWVRSTKAT
jgi:aldose sugar dehydrogenase